MSRIEKIDSAKLNFKGTGLVLCRVTREIASEWLARNTDNRLVNRAWVRTLAAMMLKKEWRDDHTVPIVFDVNGVLLDGQHRLLAVIESGVACWMRVEVGADPAVRQYLDTGRVRSLGERKTFTPDLRVNRVCAMIVRTLHYVSTGQNATPSPDMAEKIFQAMPEAIVWAASRYTKAVKGLCRSANMVAAAEFYDRCPVLAQRFWDSYIDPDGEVQQARMLRDWMLRSPAGANSASDDYERAIAAMVAAFDGREIQLVRRVAKWPEYVTEKAGASA